MPCVGQTPSTASGGVTRLFNQASFGDHFLQTCSVTATLALSTCTFFSVLATSIPLKSAYLLVHSPFLQGHKVTAGHDGAYL